MQGPTTDHFSSHGRWFSTTRRKKNLRRRGGSSAKVCNAPCSRVAFHVCRVVGQFERGNIRIDTSRVGSPFCAYVFLSRTARISFSVPHQQGKQHVITQQARSRPRSIARIRSIELFRGGGTRAGSRLRSEFPATTSRKRVAPATGILDVRPRSSSTTRTVTSGATPSASRPPVLTNTRWRSMAPGT